MNRIIISAILGLFILTHPSQTTALTQTFHRAIDSSIQVNDQNTIHYAYGPSIIYEDDKYHMIYCSNGHPNGYPNSWDYLRYTSSNDGLIWQPPSVILQGAATNNQEDLAACLGSVVYYQNHYYLFYESAQRIPGTAIDPTNPTHGTQTVIQVARADNISGPYFTYNKRGNWNEVNPPDPQPIITPFDPNKGGPTNLGAGKPIAVVKDNVLHMWYTDDTINPHGFYHLTSTSPEKWTKTENSITNTFGTNSSTIKYDPTNNNFIMLYIDDYLRKYPSLISRTSQDGATWTNPKTIINTPLFPFFSHSPGLASDRSGHIIKDNYLLGFGACPELYKETYCDNIDLYDLYTVELNDDFLSLNSDVITNEILRNPGFETGLISSWHKDPSQITFSPSITNVGHSGSFGLSLESATGILYQDISGLNPNADYSLNVWAKSSTTNTSTIHFWLYDLINNKTISESPKYKPLSNWHEFSFIFKAPQSGSLRLHLSYLQGSDPIIIDDLSLQPVAKQGDLNNDGKVDIFDYQRLVSNFGNPYTIFDYQKVISNFGR